MKININDLQVTSLSILFLTTIFTHEFLQCIAAATVVIAIELTGQR